MKRAFILITILFLAITAAKGAARKTTHSLTLGETAISVNVYENAAANVTFFAPHHNEQSARLLAREYVERNGGRLVEIESFDDKGNAARYLKFQLKGKIYTIDPNRIYTANGRTCTVAAEAQETVKAFAENLLKLMLGESGKTLRDGERFVVAVHNNADVDAKIDAAKSSDLTATAFVKAQSSERLADGAYKDQAAGVYLSNVEADADNFIFLSSLARVGYFAEKGFNVVVQKSAARLSSTQCSIDDGSLSVYAALNAIEYICLEADGANGQLRQRQMFEAVYALLSEQKQVEPAMVAGTK